MLHNSINQKVFATDLRSIHLILSRDFFKGEEYDWCSADTFNHTFCTRYDVLRIEEVYIPNPIQNVVKGGEYDMALLLVVYGGFKLYFYMPESMRYGSKT